ncbi:MAG: flippase-like domain-containing protein [Bacteroidales bacterium]|nr:flippase-like domain-containing protein [Bacteroidales bacterium]
MKNALKTVLKVAVSVAAIWWVLSKVDIHEVVSYVAESSFGLLLMALLVYIISQVFSAERNNVLYKTVPLNLGRWENVKLYWLGMVYNFILPGGVGGDVYKVYYLKKNYECSVKNIVALLLSDRISGLVAIVIYLLVLVSMIIAEISIMPFQEYLWVLIPFAVAGYYVVVYYLCRNTIRQLWKVILFSLLIQGLQMVAAILIVVSLGGQVENLQNYIFWFCMSSIASAIPISVGGIGSREATFVLGSQYLNVDNGMSVAFSAVFYMTSLVASLPGLTYVLRPEWIKKH